jgi:hypothetical protein
MDFPTVRSPLKVSLIWTLKHISLADRQIRGALMELHDMQIVLLVRREGARRPFRSAGGSDSSSS